MARDLERRNGPDFPEGGAEWLAIETGQLTRSEMTEILRLICMAAGLDRKDVGRIHAGDGFARFEVARARAERILARKKKPGSPRIWKADEPD